MTQAATIETPTQAAPILKWAGGKRQLLPEIREHVPTKFGRYFEPFVGGGAVFFDLFASGRIQDRAYLGDSNGDLIATYETVRDDTENLVTRLRSHARQHSEAHYYETRDQRPVSKISIATRMIYLNRTCFNGLYRVNKSGRFNVPVGRYTNPTICDQVNLHACAQALKLAELTCADFASVVAVARRGDFVYFDPPYVPASETGDFTKFTPNGFTEADQHRLVVCAQRLKETGVNVLLSNADLPDVRKLYDGFERLCTTGPACTTGRTDAQQKSLGSREPQ